MDARAAWDWLTDSGDSRVVSLHDLEYILWYQLPAKFLTDLEDHRKVAIALADLLTVGARPIATAALWPLRWRAASGALKT